MPSNPSSAAVRARSIGNPFAARAPAPSGDRFARPRRPQAILVARKGIVDAEQVVADGDRLGRLGVGVAGHDAFDVLLGEGHERARRVRRPRQPSRVTRTAIR